jgi:hypothetical protein
MEGATQAQRDNCDEDCLISYRGRTVRVPRQRIHADAAIALHTFAFMVRDDTEFRYCIDSDFNNAAAFLALPKASWQALEAEYGTAAVDFRFLAIAPDVDTFLAEVVFNDDPRCHPDDDEGEPGPLETLLTELTNAVTLLAASVDSGVDVYPMLIMDKFMHLLVVTSSVGQRDSLHVSANFKAGLDSIRSTLAVPEIDLQSVSFEARDVLERNDDALYGQLWWQQGSCLQLRWDHGAAPDYNARIAQLAASLPKKH